MYNGWLWTARNWDQQSLYLIHKYTKNVRLHKETKTKKNYGISENIVFDYYKLDCTDLRFDLEEFGE